MNIKCIGCYELVREEIKLSPRELTRDEGGSFWWKPFKITGGLLVLYDCPRFTYATTIGGLLRPCKGIIEAVRLCPDNPLGHCAVCSTTKIIHYGQDIVSICSKHDLAWGKWLDEHPERRAYLAPKGRVRQSNWIEVFREFIEDMRKEAKKC